MWEATQKPRHRILLTSAIERRPLMERKTIGLIGAIAGLAAAAPLYAAKAEAAPLPEAGSYAELLAPVSDPGMILRAHDAHLEHARTEEPTARLRGCPGRC